MNRVVAYVDGFNLYFGLKEAHGRRFLWLDLQRLVVDLLQPDQHLHAVQYFTARIRDDPEGGSRQSIYLDALANHSPGSHNRGAIQGEAARMQKLRS